MAAARSRHHRRRGRLWPSALFVVLVAAGLWWFAPQSLHLGNFHANLGLTPESPASAGERAIHEPEQSPPPVATPTPTRDEKHPIGDAPSSPPAVPDAKSIAPNPAPPSEISAPANVLVPSTNKVSRGEVSQLISAGREALAKEDLLTARTKLNQAISTANDAPEREALRADLNRIGAETIFSQRIIDGDPLVARHVIQIGDNLAKIASSHKLSADLLARINRLPDKNHIREGQTLKVLNGPFRAVVTKSTYTLDLYLGDVLVGAFKVGLGAEDSTPTGEWRVRTKLVNPTYYPPRGGGIIAADDPKNPLGERWIGLEGVSGSAVGQERYGIHGTNEPDSVGKNMSMGCIRMKNEDVEQVYDYLVETHSTVLVRQ
ncbi:MAG: L,D-transpeptidase family protein [Planctomycetes bacterium]|nr:L,D-transpeptidase family protein [Planctomycetota bacterium]MBI3835119.1 L,D-transpeptidase family protein [Planctomycetota bacterium]